MSDLNNWKSWIEDFRSTTLKTYENEPDRIREDFGSESRVSDDYKGRALLELLQNADDAQLQETTDSYKIGNKWIIFHLTKDALYCANGGYVMTKPGLNSICRLSHSPKDRSRLTIGEKGLGFKSVLSFSKTPEIHSGALHCRFNRQDAFNFIYTSEIIKKEKTDLTSDKVPLLRIPIWIDDDSWQNDPLLVDMSKQYATIIKLPILENEFDVIYKKLKEIKPTILLFLNFLETTAVKIDKGETQSYGISRKNLVKQDSYEIVPCLLKDDNEDTTWNVIRRSYDIPPDKLTGMPFGWENVTQCGVAFAVQNKDNEPIPLDESFDNSIRVFFPTNELLILSNIFCKLNGPSLLFK